MHPSRAAMRATRSLPYETVSANLDALSRTGYLRADQVRIMPRIRDLVIPPARRRQPPTSTERRPRLHKSVLGLVGLGSTYASQSDYTNAAINYERALGLDETSAEAHWGLAMAYAYLGESGRARGHLDRFKQLNPGSPRVAELERLVGSVTSQPTAPPNAAPPHR